MLSPRPSKVSVVADMIKAPDAEQYTPGYNVSPDKSELGRRLRGSHVAPEAAPYAIIRSDAH